MQNVTEVCLADECVSVTSKYLHRAFPGKLACHTASHRAVPR